MDWLDFSASVVDSLAWPAVLVIFLLLIRGQLQDAVGRLARVKVDGKSAELEFHSRLDSAASEAQRLATSQLEELSQELSNDVEDLPASPTPAGMGSDAPGRRDESTRRTRQAAMEFPYQEFYDEMTELAGISPAAAIAESYARLEHFVRSNLQRHELVDSDRRSLRELVTEAGQQEFLHPKSIALLADLTHLRNVVTHDRGAVDPSSEEAIKFAGIARAVAFDLAMRLSRTGHDVTMAM